MQTSVVGSDAGDAADASPGDESEGGCVEPQPSGGVAHSDALDSKARRKEAKAAAKAERKAARAAPPEARFKPCHLCAGAHPLLIRCRIDAAGLWRMVCGKCWTTVSGGVTDGDAAHPHYVYGGLWKAKR